MSDKEETTSTEETSTTNATAAEVSIPIEEPPELTPEQLVHMQKAALLASSKQARADTYKLNHKVDKAKALLRLLFQYDMAHPNLFDKLEPLAEKLQEAIVSAETPFLALDDPQAYKTLVATTQRTRRLLYRLRQTPKDKNKAKAKRRKK